jgi:hypothetical protein
MILVSWLAADEEIIETIDSILLSSQCAPPMKMQLVQYEIESFLFFGTKNYTKLRHSLSLVFFRTYTPFFIFGFSFRSVLNR